MVVGEEVAVIWVAVVRKQRATLTRLDGIPAHRVEARTVVPRLCDGHAHRHVGAVADLRTIEGRTRDLYTVV